MSKIEKTAVSLTILGQTIQPDEITQLLGCRPTQAAKTGDRIPLSNGKTRLVKIGFWKLDYGVIDAIELDQKIEQLLEPLTSDLKTWDQIAQSGAIELFCGLFVGAWNEGFTLPATLIQKLGQRHIQLSFDIYAPVGSWYKEEGEEHETHNPRHPMP